jgi:hypothetical protein
MKSARIAARPAGALIATLAAVGLLAGCGSTPAPAARPTVTVTVTAPPPSTASPVPSSPTATPSPTPTPTGAPACATSALAVRLGPGNGAAGSIYYPIEFTNASSVACTVYGYPGVSFVTASGAQAGAAAAEDATYPRALVTLAPGTTARAELRVTNAANYPASACQPVTVHRLRVYPPGETRPVYLTLKATACASTSVQILSVQTVRPGNGLAGSGGQ